jgi:hypothetical protein
MAFIVAGVGVAVFLGSLVGVVAGVVLTVLGFAVVGWELCHSTNDPSWHCGP